MYRKAVDVYTRKVSYINIFTRGQPRQLIIFFTRLISCKIFFPRGKSDRIVLLHKVDLVKKYMDLFLCEIDLVQKQNFTRFQGKPPSPEPTHESDLDKMSPMADSTTTREKHRTNYFLYEDDIV